MEPSTAPARPVFRKLPGRMPLFRTTWGPSCSLWLSDDYLLMTERLFFQQGYRRFAYPDIQALLLRVTPRSFIYSLVLGGMGAAFLWPALAMDNLAAQILFGSIAIFWSLLLLVNLVRGKTCRCELQTGLGMRVLPSLGRVGPARRALRMIADRVEASQGSLSHEEVESRLERLLSGIEPTAVS